MLKGKSITLRPVRESDLDPLYTFHVDIDNRGDFFPRGVIAEPTFRTRFKETGAFQMSWEPGRDPVE